MVTLQHVFTLSCRMKRLVRDIADANISVTCMPITACTEFDVSKFWSMVMTVDPDMEEGEGGGGGCLEREGAAAHCAKLQAEVPRNPAPAILEYDCSCCTAWRFAAFAAALVTLRAGECCITVNAFSRVMEAKKPAHK